LAAASQVVKHGSLAAVGIPGKSDSYAHGFASSFKNVSSN
jgi:hypothetical protein